MALILAVGAVLAGCSIKPEEEKTEKATVELWYYWDSTHNRRELRKND